MQTQTEGRQTECAGAEQASIQVPMQQGELCSLLPLQTTALSRLSHHEMAQHGAPAALMACTRDKGGPPSRSPYPRIRSPVEVCLEQGCKL